MKTEKTTEIDSDNCANTNLDASSAAVDILAESALCVNHTANEHMS